MGRIDFCTRVSRTKVGQVIILRFFLSRIYNISGYKALGLFSLNVNIVGLLYVNVFTYTVRCQQGGRQTLMIVVCYKEKKNEFLDIPVY